MGDLWMVSGQDKHLSQTVGWGAVEYYDDLLTIRGSLKTYKAFKFFWLQEC